MSPGPDFVMVLKNALQYNLKTAIYTALGISLGIGVHIIYSVVGVAYLLQQNKTLFQIIKYAGMIYIIYIGIKTFMSKLAKINLLNQQHKKQISPLKAIKTGFITNVLNPKASLFFMSLFSLLIPSNTPSWVLSGISLMLITITFLWFTIVSYIFTNKMIIKSYQKYETFIVKLFGVILILLGISILFEK